jgi:UDP-2,3-diacylglucosamine pyrophosphatase LpxH
MGGIVVADTHFGIRKDNSISMPGYFADFLRWVKQLEIEGKQSVKILDREVIKEKTMIAPENLIFLGDIIELWDSEDEAVNACVTLLLPTLMEISAEKIYVLGNHDNTLDKAMLSSAKEYYSLGNSSLKIVDDTYPIEGFMTVGDQNYVFVHGHQFSQGLLFQIASVVDKIVYHLSCHRLKTKIYDLIPSLKRIRNTMGTVSWVFIVLFFLSLIPYLLNLVSICGLSKSIISWIYNHRVNVCLLFLFGFLALPKILIDCARPLHSCLSGELRYKKEEAIDKFVAWWDNNCHIWTHSSLELHQPSGRGK